MDIAPTCANMPIGTSSWLKINLESGYFVSFSTNRNNDLDLVLRPNDSLAFLDFWFYEPAAIWKGSGRRTPQNRRNEPKKKKDFYFRSSDRVQTGTDTVGYALHPLVTAFEMKVA